MDHKLRRVNRTLAFSGAVLDFYKDEVVLPDGKHESWDFLYHKKGGGACVVPVLADGRILMIRQYRPAIDRETLELPAGARDSAGEDASLTARRELEEETGYTCESLTPLLHLKTAVAYCSESTDVYLAEGLVPSGAQHLDEAEEIAYEPHELSELLSLIYDGTIQDAKTVAGILAYSTRKLMKQAGEE